MMNTVLLFLILSVGLFSHVCSGKVSSKSPLSSFTLERDVVEEQEVDTEPEVQEVEAGKQLEGYLFFLPSFCDVD